MQRKPGRCLRVAARWEKRGHRRSQRRSFSTVYCFMDAQDSPRLERVSRWFRRTWHIVLVVALVLVAIRVALPYTLKTLINQRLQKIPEFDGAVRDIDLHLWRGGYQLEGVEIVKSAGATREPFFKAQQIDFSLAWRDLFR